MATMGRKRDVLAVALAAMLLAPCLAQVEPCPSNRALSGYSSIAAINNDMETEFNRISGGGAPEAEYLFTLCPRQVFEAAPEPLRPLLSGAVFQCGAAGLSTDNCIFRGGAEQVRVEDSALASYPLQQIAFSGITFDAFENNAESTGASINVFASSTTAISFNDVHWEDFNSEFIVRQQTAGDGTPASVTVENGSISNGAVGVLFDNDGGSLSLTGLQIEGITSQVIVSSANGATSTLAQTTIRSSTVDSVTSSASGAVQRVDDTTVSNMLDLEDVFIGTGTDTRVFLTRVTVENNILDERWRVLNIRDGAQGRADETTISRNTNLQFAFTASSSRSVLVIDDSFLTNNFGLGRDTTSAPVIGLQGAIVSVERTVFDGNNAFTSQALAFFGSFLTIQQSCIQDSDSAFVVFVDDESSFSGTLNFVDDLDSSFCPAPGNRLFQESDGSACFLGGPCEGDCQVLATSDLCVATLDVAGAPTNIPTPAPITPTMVPTLTPTQNPTRTLTPTTTTRLPTTSPTSGPTTAAPFGTPTQTPTSGPTTVPVTGAPNVVVPTAAPSVCPGGQVVKVPKRKPKKKLSTHGREGRRKKKSKDIHPTQTVHFNEWYNYDEVSADQVPTTGMAAEDNDYYYVVTCPPIGAPTQPPQETQPPQDSGKGGKGKGSKGKGSKGKGKDKSKKGSEKSKKGKKEKGNKEKSKKKSKKKSKRQLLEELDHSRPTLRRQSL